MTVMRRRRQWWQIAQRQPATYRSPVQWMAAAWQLAGLKLVEIMNASSGTRCVFISELGRTPLRTEPKSLGAELLAVVGRWLRSVGAVEVHLRMRHL